ncbi:reverse transcriptase domain-containing protein [Bacteroidota bacterium]
MRTFEEYITEEEIIHCLCRIRAKHAKQRNKRHLLHLLSSSDASNYHINASSPELINDEIKQLKSMLPSRRLWKKLDKKHRYNKNNQRINNVDYNMQSLLITIAYYKNKSPNEPFLVNLRNFIRFIRNNISDKNYKIGSPEIVPKFKGNKDSKKNTCRPIAMYNLVDRIIIGLTNKYLTEYFDKYFYSKSFAFRAVQKFDGYKKFLTHHDAVRAIKEYKKTYDCQWLWVSECDISKFYDSVHHTIIKRLFKRLIEKAKKENIKFYDERAERIFYNYLDSYSFTKNVLPLKCEENRAYWESKKIPGGEFGWIEDSLIKTKQYKSFKKTKIGVPQGGALSGLISNIVLDFVDRQIQKINDPRLFYTRFCDDMIMIHPVKAKCQEASQIYYNSLVKLKLIPHKFAGNLKNTPSSFWSKNTKSKKTYKWSYSGKNVFPWIGFVGYEINYSCHTRVRKSSLLKEKKKQKDVVFEIINAIKKGKRKSAGTIFESAANRLIGMSVGRVNMINYKIIKNEMCWVNGFTEITDNKHVRAQLKSLDNSRARQLSRLLNVINTFDSDPSKRTRITIPKYAFLVIKGFTEKDSIEVRKQLVDSGILNSKFQLKSNIDPADNDLNLGLKKEYTYYREEIIRILMNPEGERKAPYYGKPFSYYYQVIEKRFRNNLKKLSK